MSTHHFSIAWLAIAFTTLTACVSKKADKIPDDAIVVIGKAVLTNSELQSNMPGGLNNDDSARYANAYVRTWIDDQLVRQVAAKEIDLTDINKEVDRYRNQLIMLEYTRQMFELYGGDEISEDSLQRYYDSHKEEFRLTRPLVKGLYLKVADDAKSLPMLRKLYRSNKEADIDRLEKSELHDAVHYDYFRDKWIDWEQIECRIPYEFGESSDLFLKTHDHIDTSHGGFTYLLEITDYLPTGALMPFDVAKSHILERINFYQRRNYESQLKKGLYDDGIASGRVKILSH